MITIKKTVSILLLIFFLVSVSQAAVGKSINLNDINFDISPDRIKEDTYIPLDQLRKHISIRVVELSEERTLVYYNNDYYIIKIGSNIIRTNSDNLYLQKEPLKINDHMLLPLEFLVDCLKINIKQRPNLKRPNPIGNNNIRLEMFVEEKVVKNIVKVYLLLENKSSHKQVLTFNSGQIYDFFIRNQSGSIVYKWSEDKFFTQAFKDVKLEPQESILYDQTLKINNLKPGIYYLQGEITSQNKDLITDEIRLVVK